jgi:putative oxidoreductase
MWGVLHSEATVSNNNLASVYARIVQVLNLLQSPFALLVRIYVGWVFLKSGWLKISDWGQTLSLFESEYHVPLLPPHAAAVAGTAGELVFSVLVILGVWGRLSAIGLFAVNALAVISYAHVLYQEGFEAAIGQHYLWGFMLLVLIFYGPGALSVDGVLARRSTPPRAI